ncbi:MAG: hydrogenase maturation protease [Chloroflexi bacterium]|uniref:Hydrogenase maturation protease n=1 Tax=Candidatus Thermofonsia Clade 3 bacterium TaxID=2364212 RepID=A0A2M8QGK6_9CHLR|nr:hydrogenase maturation protease [Candidatus Roseilinea sp. NK_OTU-006]PJF48943.1 MAG: hydrogenase maturation protease [Candidatus Thermofonsia Clade 3 bacterium]RMG65124.1 MAG: hydrogenase maturation protease [Chloroflexota bacterium]
MSKGVATDFLIIGYGNTLRQDDGAGPRVAEIVASWHLPNVRAISMHQLTPELADALASAEVVIFVDARRADPHVQPPADVTFTAIGAAEDGTRAADTHTSDPRRLLALTQQLYGRCPQAWLVSVPGVDFDFGESLSERARQGVEVALRRIRLLFTSR